jgi:2OG-Fe(II) oxygenase superfamily
MGQMFDTRKVLGDLLSFGYSIVPLGREEFSFLVDLSTSVFQVDRGKLLALSAANLGGVLGYYPSSETSFALSSEFGVAFQQFTGDSDRGYSSFDFLPPTYRAGHSIFRGNFEEHKRALPLRIAVNIDRYLGSIEAGVETLANEFIRTFSRSAVSNSRENVPRLVRVLRYEASDDPGGTSKAHTDYELLTLVVGDRGGLEVLDAKGTWIKPDVGERCGVILAGDMAGEVSGGRIRSVPHRVARGRSVRHSFVFFMGVSDDLELSLPDFDPLLTFGEFWRSMLIRNCPHLREDMIEVCADCGVRCLKGNPFRSVRPWPDAS